MKVEKLDEGYYEYLKEVIGGYRGEFEEIIYHVPEIFDLMTKLLNEKLDKKDKLMISAALGYFVAPIDVIPEKVYGPYGYLDDLYICAYVLTKIQKKYGWSVLRQNWIGIGDIDKVIPDILEKSERAVSEKKDEILGYVGLK